MEQQVWGGSSHSIRRSLALFKYADAQFNKTDLCVSPSPLLQCHKQIHSKCLNSNDCKSRRETNTHFPWQSRGETDTHSPAATWHLPVLANSREKGKHRRSHLHIPGGIGGTFNDALVEDQSSIKIKLQDYNTDADYICKYSLEKANIMSRLMIIRKKIIIIYSEICGVTSS